MTCIGSGSGALLLWLAESLPRPSAQHRGKALPEAPRLHPYGRREQGEGRLRSTGGVGECWQAHGGPILYIGTLPPDGRTPPCRLPYISGLVGFRVVELRFDQTSEV